MSVLQKVTYYTDTNLHPAVTQKFRTIRG